MSQDELNLLSPEELQETIERAKAALEAKRSEVRSSVLAEIRRLADSIGVTVTIADAIVGTRKTVAAKYRDGANTWSGRGIRPKWLQARLAEGRTVEEFAI